MLGIRKIQSTPIKKGETLADFTVGFLVFGVGHFRNLELRQQSSRFFYVKIFDECKACREGKCKELETIFARKKMKMKKGQNLSDTQPDTLSDSIQVKW